MSTASDARALARYLAIQIGPLDRVVQSHTPWHSATFAGARHQLVCSVGSSVDMTTFACDLPEADIQIPGGFVADALVTSVEPIADGKRVTVEFLTITAD